MSFSKHCLTWEKKVYSTWLLYVIKERSAVTPCHHTQVLSSALVQAYRKNGQYTSGVLWIFWFLSFLTATVKCLLHVKRYVQVMFLDASPTQLSSLLFDHAWLFPIIKVFTFYDIHSYTDLCHVSSCRGGAGHTMMFRNLQHRVGPYQLTIKSLNITESTEINLPRVW